MFEIISIVVVTLRRQRRIQTLIPIGRSLPSLAVSNDASPHGWSQNWSQRFSNAASHSRISTLNALLGLPWAQGVAGSNPVAPTTFRVPEFQRGSACRRAVGRQPAFSHLPPPTVASNVEASSVGTLQP